MQWGGASVWKVGGKIFAVCAPWGGGPHDKISFKCSPLAFRILREQPGIAPAPYLARAEWVQVQEPDALTDTEIRRYIAEAYAIVSAKLTRAVRKELGH